MDCASPIANCFGALLLDGDLSIKFGYSIDIIAIAVDILSVYLSICCLCIRSSIFFSIYFSIYIYLLSIYIAN